MSQVQIVPAESVSDYLSRYYKQDRLKSVDNAYGAGTLLSFYEIDFKCFGFVCTSHYDNTTGEFIAWPKYTPELITDGQRQECNKLRSENQNRIDRSQGKVTTVSKPEIKSIQKQFTVDINLFD